MSFLNNLLGDSRLGGILAVVIGLCVLGLIAIYVFRALGRGVRSNGNRSPRQPRLGIVDAFDLDRHRQLVLVRRDNVEHLIMIGGPNDLLIEGAIVRAQPAGLEGRREPGLAAPAGNERAAPRLAIENAEEGRPEPRAERPVEPPRPEPSRAEPRGEPLRTPAPAIDPRPATESAPPLRPAIEPAASAPEPVVAPPPPLARPTPPAFPNRPAPPPPRPLPPLRPVTPSASAGSKLPPPPAPARAAPPPPPPPVAPASPPASAAPASAPESRPEGRAESQAAEPPPRFAVNIDSLEEEMAKLLGRPPGNKS